MFVFSIDIPLKVARTDRIWGPRSQRCHICTAVSLTPLCMSYGVNDTALHVTTKLDCRIKTVLRFIRKNILQSWLHRGVVDTAVMCTAMSLTPLWHALQYHCYQCDMHIRVIDTALICTAVTLTLLWNQLCQFSANSKPYSNSLYPVYQGPRERCLMKKITIATKKLYMSLLSVFTCSNFQYSRLFFPK
jgi:hypothetical protein